MELVKNQFEYCEYFNKEENKKEYYVKAVISSWHFASFDNLEQVNRFFNLFGIKKQQQIINREDFKSWNINKIFVDAITFWESGQVPEKAKPVKALCNGSVVDCYFTNVDNIVTFYRPNPNAENVYVPLDFTQRVKHEKINGIY